MLLGIAVLRSDGAKPLIEKFSQQRAWIAGALAVANSFALHHNLRRYVTGLDERGFNLDAGREWWWFGLRESAHHPDDGVGHRITRFCRLWRGLLWSTPPAQVSTADTSPMSPATLNPLPRISPPALAR